MPRKVASMDGGVGHHDYRQVLVVPLSDAVEQELEKALGETALVAVGDCNHIAGPRHFDDMLVGVLLVEVAEGMDVQGPPGGAEDVVLGSAVVVSGGHHDGHAGLGLVHLGQGVDPLGLDGSRRLGRVKDVAAQ